MECLLYICPRIRAASHVLMPVFDIDIRVNIKVPSLNLTPPLPSSNRVLHTFTSNLSVSACLHHGHDDVLRGHERQLLHDVALYHLTTNTHATNTVESSTLYYHPHVCEVCHSVHNPLASLIVYTNIFMYISTV